MEEDFFCDCLSCRESDDVFHFLHDVSPLYSTAIHCTHPGCECNRWFPQRRTSYDDQDYGIIYNFPNPNYASSPAPSSPMSSVSSMSNSEADDDEMVETLILDIERDHQLRTSPITTPILPPVKEYNFEEFLSEMDRCWELDSHRPTDSDAAPAIPTTVQKFDYFEDEAQYEEMMPSPPSGDETTLTPTGAKKRRPRQHQLWQFILETLIDDRYCPSIIEWVRRDEGVFRFVEPQKVARLWGERRKRDNMTYEHFSRSMRHYYSKDVMRRSSEFGRLVYQFLSKATGWREKVRKADLAKAGRS